jgi:FtsZ-interacting cell division protein YlmF
MVVYKKRRKISEKSSTSLKMPSQQIVSRANPEFNTTYTVIADVPIFKDFDTFQFFIQAFKANEACLTDLNSMLVYQTIKICC